MISFSRLAVVLAALPAAFAASLSPRANHQPEARIVGGHLAQAGEFPFIVQTIWNGSALCAGTLINAQTILTAAHCTDDYINVAQLFRVRVGSLESNTGGIETNVSGYIIHPEWDRDTSHNDLALWKLSEPIHESADISYATLPPQDPEIPCAGSDVTLMGWGSLAYNSTYYGSQYLQEVTVPVVPHDTCQAMFQHATGSQRLLKIGPGQFCGGLAEGGKGSCFGDSGSPVVDSQSKVLYGLVSLSLYNSCANPGDYDIYTRISAYVDWISKNKF